MGLICNTANKSLRRVGFLSLNFCSTPPAAALITRCNIFPYLPTEHLYHSATHVHLSKCYEKKKKSLELAHSTLKQNASIVYITSVLLIMLELENRKQNNVVWLGFDYLRLPAIIKKNRKSLISVPTHAQIRETCTGVRQMIMQTYSFGSFSHNERRFEWAFRHNMQTHIVPAFPDSDCHIDRLVRGVLSHLILLCFLLGDI